MASRWVVGIEFIVRTEMRSLINTRSSSNDVDDDQSVLSILLPPAAVQ